MPIKLNLGSHNKDIGNDYINVDILELGNVDLLCNLNQTPFYFKVKKSDKVKDWDFLFEDNLEGKTSFMLENNCIDEIVMDEVLEHLSFRITERVLNEIFRILKVGGVFKLQVPDCGAAMRAWVEKKICRCVPHKAFVDGEFRAKKDCPQCQGKAIMDWERWLFSFTGAQKHQFDTHLAIFTKDILSEELRKAKFDFQFIDNPVKLKVIATK